MYEERFYILCPKEASIFGGITRLAGTFRIVNNYDHHFELNRRHLKTENK